MATWLRVFAARCSALFSRRKADNEFGDEIETHIQMLTERFVRQGMQSEEAAAAARRQFGNTTLLAERWREARSFLSPTALWRDVRFGARQLQRNPLLTAIAVVSLALGIGANTAIFTVAKKVLFDTLPVERPRELRMLTWTSGHDRPVPPVWGDISSTEDGGLTSNAFSYPVLEALRKTTDAVADLIAFKDIPMTVSVDGQASAVAGEMISGNAFPALGVKPILGRALTTDDDSGPGKEPVAMISEGLWAERFGRAESVLGKVISLNGVPVTIVGVSPARFTGLQMDQITQIYVPLTLQPLISPRAQNTSTSLLDNPQSWWVLVLARLRPDVPEAQAQAELDVTLRQAAMGTLSHAKGIELLHLKFEPGARGLDYLGAFAKPSYVLLALAGLVLLLACVNLANLLLARAAARQREMSTRLALGAHRRHIFRQVLTESLLLAGLGGAAGLALGYFARNVIPRLMDNPWQVDFDWKVLWFTAAVSMGTGILFGLVPAWQATRTGVNAALKDTGHGTATRQRVWLGKGLVVFQIALSTILLIGAGLFVRTLVNLSNRPLGFSDHILLFQLRPSRIRYPNSQLLTLYRQTEEKLSAIPGVESVSISGIAIIGDGHSGSSFHVSGSPVEKDAARVQANGVGVDFFSTMQIPILQGRSFNSRDTSTSPKVAIVNRALAKKYFPNQDPVGRTFDADSEDIEGPVEIVGIIPDTRYADLRSETPPTFYAPYVQGVEAAHRMVVEMRTNADPSSVLSQARIAVASLDKDLPLIDARTMTEQVKATMSDERIFAQLTGAFGVLALVLAAIGIYGIMAYTVASRTSEIGIRMALGAQTEQVIGMILREAWWMAAAGVTLGTIGALWFARFVGTMLYGLKPADPLTLAGAALLLAAISLIAAAGPARRAAHVDPIRALRHE
jgi:predicted permease